MKSYVIVKARHRGGNSPLKVNCWKASITVTGVPKKLAGLARVLSEDMGDDYIDLAALTENVGAE